MTGDEKLVDLGDVKDTKRILLVCTETNCRRSFQLPAYWEEFHDNEYPFCSFECRETFRRKYKSVVTVEAAVEEGLMKEAHVNAERMGLKQKASA